MNTKHGFASFFLLLVAIAATTATHAAQSNPKRPNILLILADDLGYSDIGAFGSEISTPNLDALAREGRIMTSMYSTPMPISRAELMTGADHHLVGFGSMYIPWGKQKESPNYVRALGKQGLPISELLRDAGYHTYMVGTWHLGEEADQSPKARGFESSYALLGAAGDYFALSKDEPKPASAHTPPVYREDGELIEPATTYATDLFTDKLLSYLSRNTGDGKPFFAYAAYTSPKFPLQVTDDFINRYRGRYDAGYDAIRLARIERQKKLGVVPSGLQPSQPVAESPTMKLWGSLSAAEKKREARRMEIYAAMVENLDWNIGRVIAKLKATGQYDETFIVFTCGNGAAQGFTEAPENNEYENMGRKHSWIYMTERWAEVSNAPFSLWKSKPKEGGISVPAIFRLPGQQKAASIAYAPATLKDIAPTLLELAQITAPGREYKGHAVVPITGRSLLPLLKGKTKSVHPNDAVFADEGSGEAYVRQGEWKAVLMTEQHTNPFERGDPLNARHIELLRAGYMEGAAKERAKYPARWSLYNIKQDRGENVDLAGARPDVLRRLQALYEQYRKDNGVTDPL